MNIETEAFVQNVVLHSANFKERIALYLKGVEFQETADSQARLNQWKKQFQLDSSAALQKRITALGLSPTDLPKVLGSPRSLHIGSIPDWAQMLRSILEEIFDPHGYEQIETRFASQFAGNIPPVYPRLYWPIVRCASKQLKQATAALHIEFSDDAYVGLEAHLLSRLLEAGRQVTQLQFAVFENVTQVDFACHGPTKSMGVMMSPPDFIGPVPGKRLFQLFEAYPVHARHCATLALDWVNATSRFLARLAHDCVELSERFNNGISLRKIVRLQAGLSDPHHRGETVVLVTFAAERQIIYKPRSLAVEQWFSDLLSSIGDTRSFRNFKAPLFWDRGDYGWAEFISARHCFSSPEVKRYYWRAGALLGLLHLSKGVDCHQNNLIAHGEFPILIDLEALWHPQNLSQPSSQQRRDISSTRPIDSVLRTGFFPGGSVDNSHLYAASALVSDPDLEYYSKPSTEQNRGQNVRANNSVRNLTHVPHIRSIPVGITRCAREFMAGFRWTGTTFLLSTGQRERLTKRLDQLRRCPRRRIYRSTAAYNRILQLACIPALLKEGIDFSLTLQNLLAAQGSATVREREEINLARLDMPYFLQPATMNISSKLNLPLRSEQYFSQLRVIWNALRE